MNPSDLEVKGQGRNIQKPIQPCEHNRDQIFECVLIKIDTDIAQDERINPIDVGG